MQGDLISRSALHDTICKRFNIEDDWDGDIAEPLQTILDIIENFDIAYDVDEVIAETDEVLADLNVVEIMSHIDADKTIQKPLLDFLSAFRMEIGRLIRNGGKE